MIKDFLVKIKTKIKKRKYRKIHFSDGGKTVRIIGNVDFGGVGGEPYLIQIGKNVTLTDGVKLITHDGACSVIRVLYGRKNIDLIKPIVIGDNVFVGNNVQILYGVTIGSNVIIGCGSVVTNDLKANGVYAGVPARRICSIEDFYNKHQNDFLETKSLSIKKKEKFLTEYFNNSICSEKN